MRPFSLTSRVAKFVVEATVDGSWMARAKRSSSMASLATITPSYLLRSSTSTPLELKPPRADSRWTTETQKQVCGGWGKHQMFSACRWQPTNLEGHLFTRVLGILESSFSGTQVLKLSELVLRIHESSFSDPRKKTPTSDLVLKTSESSFIESDCGVTLPNAGCLYNLVL